MTTERTVPCSRCGRPCRVAGRGKPGALMLRRSAVPRGHCVDCSVTNFLMNTYPVNVDLDEKGPEGLLVPGQQRLFAGLMKVFNADATPGEIDWRRVVANWYLPLPKIEKTATNPYVPFHPGRAMRDDCGFPVRDPDCTAEGYRPRLEPRPDPESQAVEGRAPPKRKPRRDSPGQLGLFGEEQS